MNKSTLFEILDTMATKASICNDERPKYIDENGNHKGNFRTFPIHSELKGMELTLKIMGIEFGYEFNEDVTRITAIKSGDIRIEVR